MKKRRCLYLALAAVLVAALWGPVRTFRSYLQGEPFYRGKPASYWSRELGRWMEFKVAGASMSETDWSKVPPQWFRERAAWEYWVWEHCPRFRMHLPNDPPILDGDVAAFDVLVRLIQDDNPQVRRMAARGLGKMKAQAMRAFPALLQRLQDEDAGTRAEAQAALQAIDWTTVVPAFNE